jgi:phosphonate transport system substrate-binding protein
MKLSTRSRRILITPFLIIFSLFFLSFSGCVKDEKPKKVSLYKKSSKASRHAEDSLVNTLWFGFDLRLGPKEEIEIYTPFLRYLEKTTGERFHIKFTEKYEDTLKNLGLGETDFAAIGSLSYVIGRNEYGIRYLVSGVNREGDPRYHAAIITRPDSDINDIRDLKGKSFAFGAKMSTQGHLIPRKMLEDAGITLDKINHVYTGSHVNAVKAVLNRERDAAGIQDTLAKRLEAEGLIKIIGLSEPYPSSLIAYNSAVSRTTVEKVKSALLAFEPAGKHKHILYDWNKTEMPLGFVAVDEAEIDKIAELAERYGLLRR